MPAPAKARPRRLPARRSSHPRAQAIPTAQAGCRRRARPNVDLGSVRDRRVGSWFGVGIVAGRRLGHPLDPRREAAPGQRLPSSQEAARMTDNPSIRRTDDASAAAESSHWAEWDARNRAAPLNAMGDNVTIQKNWQELIRPNKLQVAAGSDPKREATVVAEPLERGFGVTLGNALRRILLSSLQGAAVQSVHIDGVLHEFSSIPGVREDVTDIVLNIKDIAIKMQGDGPKRMVVKKQGPGTVTASDIQTVGDTVVLNPDLVLCTLDEGAEIRMEFTVNTGKGYVPAERNLPEDAPICP